MLFLVECCSCCSCCVTRITTSKSLPMSATVCRSRIIMRALCLKPHVACYGNQATIVVEELLQITTVQNDQYTAEGGVLGLDEVSAVLPSPAVAAADAVTTLLQCPRGTAALLQDCSLNSLFTTVQHWGVGAAASANLIATLARKYAYSRRLLFAAPQRVAVLNSLQQRMQSLKQQGLLQQPEGLTMLRIVCSMTEAAAQCRVVPPCFGDLAEMMWRVPRMSEYVLPRVWDMVHRRMGLFDLAPHARHMACAVKLHAPTSELFRLLQPEDSMQTSIELEVKMLRCKASKLSHKTQHVAVQLALIHQQYRRQPRHAARELQLAVAVLLQQLGDMSQRLEQMQQQLQRIDAAENLEQKQIEQEVRHASEQQQQLQQQQQ